MAVLPLLTKRSLGGQPQGVAATRTVMPEKAMKGDLVAVARTARRLLPVLARAFLELHLLNRRIGDYVSKVPRLLVTEIR